MITDIFLGLLSVLGFLASYAVVFFVGYQHGQFKGRMAERERRDALEARVMERLRIVAQGDREIWETEIDA
jgi:hypothetical protein